MKYGKYQHYKGKFYEVFGQARHSETLEEMVVYRSLFYCETYGDQHVWVRPKKMFCEMIEHEGKWRPRFQWVDNQ